MSTTCIRPADPADDAQIRCLLRGTAMGGDIRLAFTQEPSYFAAAPLQGRRTDTLVACAADGAAVIGVASRAERPAFIDGAAGSVGYLSGLRIEPRHRGGTVLARGFRALRGLHERGGVRYYLTTIMEDNRAARDLLASGRAGLPDYRDLGAFVTLAFTPPRSAARAAPEGVEVRAATPADLPAVFAFLDQEGRRRQFFPVYEPRDLADGLLMGLGAEDFTLAFRGGRLAGCVALWDQQSCRQRVIAGYSRRFAALRPFWNVYARAVGQPRLPRPGTVLRVIVLAALCVRNDDPAVFDALLAAALARRPASGGLDAVLLGLHERDPLLPVAARRRHRAARSRVYLVYWDDGRASAGRLDDRVPYLETGAL